MDPDTVENHIVAPRAVCRVLRRGHHKPGVIAIVRGQAAGVCELDADELVVSSSWRGLNDPRITIGSQGRHQPDVGRTDATGWEVRGLAGLDRHVLRWCTRFIWQEEGVALRAVAVDREESRGIGRSRL